MALNPIAANLRNVTKHNVKVSLSIPAGATLDDVAGQLIAAGMRESETVPAFLVEEVAEPPRRRPGRPPKQRDPIE